MTSNPWDKFFWNDWENDPALKLCSLSAQGLWMRILCICAKADPKGYMLVAGRPLSPSDLSSLVGKPVPEVETLLDELACNGVFSKDRTGRIYSRRLIRDSKKHKLAQNNGRLGGNPSLSNSKDISPSDNPKDKPPDKPHKPYANSHNQQHSAPRYPDDFEEFWKAYQPPKNSKKPDCFKAWEQVGSVRPPLAAILRAVTGYQAFLAEETRKRKSEYPKQQPSTWLRGEVWNNFLDIGTEEDTADRAELRDRIDEMLRRGKYAENYQ